MATARKPKTFTEDQIREAVLGYGGFRFGTLTERNDLLDLIGVDPIVRSTTIKVEISVDWGEEDPADDTSVQDAIEFALNDRGAENVEIIRFTQEEGN